jgi:hypothetical protein
MATLNMADVYGTASAAGTIFNPTTQVSGPNQSSVANTGQAGATPQPAGSGAAFSWLGFVLALVVLRVALEMGGESR